MLQYFFSIKEKKTIVTLIYFEITWQSIFLNKYYEDNFVHSATGAKIFVGTASLDKNALTSLSYWVTRQSKTQ